MINVNVNFFRSAELFLPDNRRKQICCPVCGSIFRKSMHLWVFFSKWQMLYKAALLKTIPRLTNQDSVFVELSDSTTLSGSSTRLVFRLVSLPTLPNEVEKSQNKYHPTEKSLDKLIDKLRIATRSLTFGTSAAVSDGDTIPGIILIVVVIPLIIPTYLRINAHNS